ncbi:MAG: AAA family ATPase, partial [Deltaproteobacteria bacterium]|nr:AAA family ATPase [Deltaproteobacteria bacterium]
MKELPIGMQTFRDLIEGGYVYADKTRHVYDLARSGKAYFLSRPRRFGKSLLLSTFEALFSGSPDPDVQPQGLFADLWIGHSGYDFTRKFPVVSLGMDLDGSTPDGLKTEIQDMLHDKALEFGLEIKPASPGRMLARLIKGLKSKFGSKVVLLIDEYDSPVSDNIDNLSTAKKNRDILKSFYSQLKSCGSDLHFVFVTGVTRYVFMGLSAGLNHLTDLTLDSKYSSICGFTIQELKNCFADRLPSLLKTMKNAGNMPKGATLEDMWMEIGLWYDGYSWDGK